MAGRGRPRARATSRAPDATATPNACRVEVREAARARRAGRTADAPPWSGHHAPSYGSLFFAGARTLEEALPEVRPGRRSCFSCEGGPTSEARSSA